MTVSEPESVGPVPFREITWCRLYAVALFSAGRMPASHVRSLIFRMLVDGVGSFLGYLESGAFCVGPLVIASGDLAVELGVFPADGDPLEPVWFALARADHLDFTEEERAWCFAMAERAGRVFTEVPDDLQNLDPPDVPPDQA